jgi:hypothetical protein
VLTGTNNIEKVLKTQTFAVQWIKDSCLRSAELKKWDCGGGMWQFGGASLRDLYEREERGREHYAHHHQ